MIDGTSEFVRQDGQRLCFAVFLAELAIEPFSWFVALEKELCGLGERPAQVSIADLLAGTTISFPIRFLGAAYQPARGDEVLYAWEAADVFDFIQQVQGDDTPDAGDGFEQGVGRRIMYLCSGADFSLEFVKHLVICLDHGQVGVNGQLYCRIIELIDQSLSALRVGNASERNLQVVLGGHVLVMH